jgi:tetratricopeptide (TPR) repeat protein
MGQVAFSQGSWHDAINRLEKVEKSSPDYLESTYFLAHAYFNNGAYDEAQNLFSDLKQMENTIYADEAEWNEAITFLAKGNIDNTKEACKKIVSNKDHLYSEHAEGLLSKLNSTFRKVIFTH